MRLVGLLPSGAPDLHRPEHPRRVLLVRPDHIGDVLLTSPAVALLRASLPDAELTYLVGPWSAEMARGGPAVDRVRTLAYPGFTRRASRNVLAPYALLAREAAAVRHERYDLALIFRPDHWWGALLALAAGIPVRVGASTPETTPLLTHARAPGQGEHAALQSLELARLALQAFGTPAAEVATDPTYRVSEADRQAASDFWDQHCLNSLRVVAIQPSAGATLKSWPVQRWASIANGLLDRGTAVLLIGGPDDGPLLTAIGSRMTHGPPPTAFGQSLGTTAGMYQRCRLVVGLDGGGAHLAAAVGTPTVRLYGPAPSDVFGPWLPHQSNQRVLAASGLPCMPCGHLEAPPCGATTLPACLLALGVDDVLNAASAELSRD